MERIVSNTRLLILLFSLLLVAGLAALKQLPRLEDPRIVNRFAIIVTPFPGASAERVEAMVSRPIEELMRELPELKDIESTSRAGISVVTMIVDDSYDDVKSIWTKARDKLEDASRSFPNGVMRPDFRDQSFSSFTLIAALEWRGSQQPNVLLMGRLAQELESRLRSLPGTEYVDIFGEPEEEIHIDLDIMRTNALGFTVAEIAALVERSDAKVSAGDVSRDEYRWQLEVRGALDTLERIRQIPLRRGSTGEVIRLGDVAMVSRAQQEPPAELAVIGGQRSITVGALARPDIRQDRWRQSLDTLLDAFNAGLPAEVEATVVFDQEIYTDKRLAELMGNIGLGFIVVLVVLLLTLGWRAALLVAMSLPLTVCFTLFGLYLLDIPIHQISVVGLVVSLGIMVDNAIVMTDAIGQERRAGQSALSATLISIQHLWVPLLGSSLTTILAFLPIVLMPGNGGEFVGAMGTAVVLSLIGSYLIAHTIVAGWAGKLLSASSSARWYDHGWQTPRLMVWFERSLAAVLRQPRRFMALIVALGVAGLVVGAKMEGRFFPPADRDMFVVSIYLPPGSGIRATELVSESLTEEIMALEGVLSVDWFMGNSAPKFYYNMLSGGDGMAFYGQAMVKATDHLAAANAISYLQNNVVAKYPEILMLPVKLEQGPPVNAPIELIIHGPDLGMLKLLGDEIKLAASKIPNVLAVRSTLQASQPKLWVDFAEDAVAQTGLSLREVSGQLQAALSGVLGGTVLEATEEIPVRVKVSNLDRTSLVRIESGYFVTEQDGRRTTVPFSALGDVDILPEQSNVSRRNGSRVNAIQLYPTMDVLAEPVLTDLKAELQKQGFTLPAFYSIELGGEADGSADAMGDLMVYVNIIIVLLVLVLALSFNSFRITWAIFFVALLSVGFGMLSLFLSGFPRGFITIVASMGLMGLAINAAIVILAELKADPAACMGSHEAIIKCVNCCGRHIVSTTLTTVGGFMPLLLDSGTFWPPFAAVIVGGTVLSGLVSFYFVPAFFLTFTRQRAFEVTRHAALEIREDNLLVKPAAILPGK